jgi:hypothetical protein
MAVDPVNPQDISPVRLVDELGEQLDGQKTMAASLPVVLASDQTDIPITLDSEAVVLGAGEAHIGQVGSEGTTIAQTPTIDTDAYTAGDNVGGLLTFASAARNSGGGGVIKNMIIIDDAGQDAELELWLFDRTFTAGDDDDAWAPTEADLENCIGVITTSGETWRAAGTPSVISVEIAMRYDLDGTSLFGRLVTRGTPTYAATDDLTVKVGLLQD